MDFHRARRIAAKVAAMGLFALVLAATSPPSAGITWGVPDPGHPFAGAFLILYQGEWLEFCSGSLAAPRVFLTAGHCTDWLTQHAWPVEKIVVSFSPTLFAPDAVWRNVTAYHDHPDYRWGPTSDPHDVGVLILEDAVTDITPVNLPSEGFLDGLATQGLLPDARFLNVGYGTDQDIQETNMREVSVSGFRNLHDAWLYMSQNIHHGDGGTCYGDSGGPTLYRDAAGVETQVAVTSWGDSPCKSTNNNYRVDTAASLSFIDEMIRENP